MGRGREWVGGRGQAGVEPQGDVCDGRVMWPGVRVRKFALVCRAAVGGDCGMNLGEEGRGAGPLGDESAFKS